MRARLVFTVIAVLLVATFAALNWSEIIRPTTLNLGAGNIFVAPLGLILLTLLGLTLLVFVAAGAAANSRHVHELNHYSRELETQRDLAERAEASRYTELRAQIDERWREHREREAIATSDFEKSVVLGQRELRNQIEQLGRNLDARFAHFEERLHAGRDAAADASRRRELIAADKPADLSADAPVQTTDHVRL